MSEYVNADERSVELSVVQQKVKKMSGNKVSDEEKAEAVRRVLEDKERVADVAHDLGVSDSAVHNWVSDYKKELAIEIRYMGVIDRCAQLEETFKDKELKIAQLKMKVGVLEDMLERILRR